MNNLWMLRTRLDNRKGRAPGHELICTVSDAGAADFRNSPLSITGIPQGTSGAEGLG
jgi:hypothetical protein